MADCSAAYPVSYDTFDMKSSMEHSSAVSAMCAALPASVTSSVASLPSSQNSQSPANVYQQLNQNTANTVLYHQLEQIHLPISTSPVPLISVSSSSVAASSVTPITTGHPHHSMCHQQQHQQPMVASLPPPFTHNFATSHGSRIPSYITLVNHVRASSSRTSDQPSGGGTFVAPPPHLLPIVHKSSSHMNSHALRHTSTSTQPQQQQLLEQQSTHQTHQQQQHTPQSSMHSTTGPMCQSSTIEHQSVTTAVQPIPLPLAEVAQAITGVSAHPPLDAKPDTSILSNYCSFEATSVSPSNLSSTQTTSTARFLPTQCISSTKGAAYRNQSSDSTKQCSTSASSSAAMIGKQLLRTRRHNSNKVTKPASGRSRLNAKSAHEDRSPHPSQAHRSNSTDRLLAETSSCPSNATTDAPSPVARRNERERNRVRHVNLGFQTLRAKIPNSTKKMSKVQTLRYAMIYIDWLQRLLNGSDHVPIGALVDPTSADPDSADDSVPENFFDLRALFE